MESKVTRCVFDDQFEDRTCSAKEMTSVISFMGFMHVSLYFNKVWLAIGIAKILLFKIWSPIILGLHPECTQRSETQNSCSFFCQKHDQMGICLRRDEAERDYDIDNQWSSAQSAYKNRAGLGGWTGVDRTRNCWGEHSACLWTIFWGQSRSASWQIELDITYSKLVSNTTHLFLPGWD